MTRNAPPLLEGGRLALLLALSGAGTAVLLARHLAWRPWQAGVLYLLLVSIAARVLFAWDKRRARREARRISESNLLGVALLGGAAGAWWAMLRDRHKTRHLRFRLGVPAALLVQAGLLAWLAVRF